MYLQQLLMISKYIQWTFHIYLETILILKQIKVFFLSMSESHQAFVARTHCHWFVELIHRKGYIH